MARGMHRHRNIRLTNLAAHKLETRARKAGPKVAARGRRDAHASAALKQYASGTIRPAWLDSWLSARLGKPASKVTADDIKSILG